MTDYAAMTEAERKEFAKTCSPEQAQAFAEALWAANMSQPEIAKILKSMSFSAHIRENRATSRMFDSLAKAKQPPKARQPDSGQFRHTKSSWLCECGHPLAFHAADKAMVDGVKVQPCIIGDFTACDCDCNLFRKARPAMAADEAVIDAVSKGKHSDDCPSFVPEKVATALRTAATGLRRFVR